MKSDVEPIRFVNAAGQMLHGIVHTPTTAHRKSTAIILLSPGIKMRVAPHRLYNKMADFFVALGYPVLRFDFYGLGDSEGEVREKFLANFYGSVQVGRYVDDTRAAMDWVSGRYGNDRFILAGLCGGAITGLLTARSDQRVKGLLALGIPVILDNENIDKTQFITIGELTALEHGYKSKFFNAKSWLRLFTFQSDYRVIWKIVRRKLFRSHNNAADGADISSQDAGPIAEDNTNPLFAPAFFDMVSGHRRILIVFSGSDRLGSEYEEKFVSRHKEMLHSYADWHQVTTVPEANHIFSMPKSQEQLLKTCEQWLGAYFPG